MKIFVEKIISKKIFTELITKFYGLQIICDCDCNLW